MEIRLRTSPLNLRDLVPAERRRLKARYKRALLRTAAVGINIIQDRTAEGRGYKDGAFKPYSADYSKFRTDKGRSTNPNLNFSGKMMNAMTSRANYKKAEIFFRGRTESGKAAGNTALRPFFGFSRDEEQVLARAFTRFLL